MSTEQTIRIQAKQSLKGNWGLLIAAVIFISIIMLFLNSVSNVIGLFFKVFDTDTGMVLNNKQWIYQIISCGMAVPALLATPLINGAYKMFYNISQNSKTEMSDLFYYFRGMSRYLKTLSLNILISLMYFVISYGLDCYAYVSAFSGKSLQNGLTTDIMTLALLGAMVVSVAIKFLAYFIFVHFVLFAYAQDDSKKVLHYVFGICSFSVKHLGETIKLLFTFLGWIALCFFVVPAFYVLPYIMTSFATSAKWLFALEKDRGLLC